MIYFKTKDNLIEWLTNNCPRKAIVRSLLQNGAECLGGFAKIPPSTRPGWIVRVTSPFGKKWIVAVLAYDDKPGYGIRILKRVPWQFYAGDLSEQEVYTGDNPMLYQQLRDICKERKHETCV